MSPWLARRSLAREVSGQTPAPLLPRQTLVQSLSRRSLVSSIQSLVLRLSARVLAPRLWRRSLDLSVRSLHLWLSEQTPALWLLAQALISAALERRRSPSSVVPSSTACAEPSQGQRQVLIDGIRNPPNQVFSTGELEHDR